MLSQGPLAIIFLDFGSFGLRASVFSLLLHQSVMLVVCCGIVHSVFVPVFLCFVSMKLILNTVICSADFIFNRFSLLFLHATC